MIRNFFVIEQIPGLPLSLGPAMLSTFICIELIQALKVSRASGELSGITAVGLPYRFVNFMVRDVPLDSQSPGKIKVPSESTTFCSVLLQ